MIEFLAVLISKNMPLFYFGLICLVGAVVLFIIARCSFVKINGVNAWYKPLKFALSIGTFSWTMCCYTGYLQTPRVTELYSWSIIILLGFELFYITLQAGRGQLSHYNVSSNLYTYLTVAMAVAAIAATLYTGYIGILFCTSRFSDLPDYYVWAIRIGIFFFVIFAFEGAIMGANGSHIVREKGLEDGLPVLNRSLEYGDLRIAHFIGMHALQILPLVAFYVFRNVKMIFILGAMYGVLALYSFIQALNGKPLLKIF